MKILSLFDGISCARVSLERAGIPVELYYASEVDKYAIQIAQKNYPATIQLGNVVGLNPPPNIDLLIGGSPCQDLSITKKNRQGLSGKRSGLFWEYVRILKEAQPRYFILENVASMPAEAKQTITETLGVEPIMINAALVSAQNRKRLFWTNIPNITLPEDRGILLKDILNKSEKAYCIPSTYWKENIKSLVKRKKNGLLIKVGHFNSGGQGDRVYSTDGKSTALAALAGGRGAKTGLYMIQTPRGNNKGGKKALDGKTPTLSSSSWEHNNKLSDNEIVRKLTPIECERLQGLPDNYTEGISNTQRYKCLGNAFNVDVVAHILKFLTP